MPPLSLCRSPALRPSRPRARSWSRVDGTVGAASVALSLPRWGEGAGDEISGPRGGWGRGVRARLRLVARSRHYASRHFLSGPGEERRGASSLAFGFFNSGYSAVADPWYRVGGGGRFTFG